ncbi:SDR family NAD(P)-dependent oxidoreductase [Pyruvatibacter mobilis]|uniref:Probable oxidoreductase n=1 Tax=Pyruvatibacter mobilis TaxID=1712261 RepID=A0A845QEX6_9HYPH|nr:oxidoreductase [Pyruvatibacter mobilis]NBG96571.1 SDR family NAD(P)-dependent oxidoreductase [Pyruvatibacter mobilis]QJD74545.1 SDR family NAD(P)-dependent oxidoreductase [Pyruvatibacter mobilis]GGD07948.1 oxidoreductase [Pyruvatibacter mobilis]
MARDFGHGTTALEVVEGIDLSGKTVIVTGASSGLGVETARALAKAGAKVVLPGRSPDKLAGVVEDIKASTGNQKVEAAEMDLGDLDSVRRFADAFVATGEPLHLLINNAGIMATPHRTTAQGFESQFGTNHLGHFVLFAHLLPALEKAGANGGARVVALSSTGHRISDVDLDDPNFEASDYHKWIAYGRAKTANALFALEVDKRYQGKGIRAFSVHPGGIMTGLQRDMDPEEFKTLGWVDENGNVRDGFKTPEQGAATATWCATAPELEGQGGFYCEDCQRAEPTDLETMSKTHRGVIPHAQDPATASALWTKSEEMVGERVPA